MQQKLPSCGFKWRNDTLNFYNDLLQNYDKNSGKGYILDVDVDYSKELHKTHSDLPFLPERMFSQKALLKPYIHMYTEPKQKPKLILKNTSSS